MWPKIVSLHSVLPKRSLDIQMQKTTLYISKNNLNVQYFFFKVYTFFPVYMMVTNKVAPNLENFTMV